MSNNTALQKSKWIEPQHKLSTKNEYGRLKQICRVDSLDSFVEVLNDSFHSDKITFNFQKYDKNNGNKTISKITFWMQLDDFLAIHKQLSVYVHKCKEVRNKAQAEAISKNDGKTIYPSLLCDLYAGTSAKMLQTYGKSRPDGLAESRKFSIVPSGVRANTNNQQYQSNKINSVTTDIVLTAEKGPGKEDSNGLIQPNYGKVINGKFTQAEEVIRVPMSYDKFIALFERTYMNYQAYLSSEVYLNRGLDLRQERKEANAR